MSGLFESFEEIANSPNWTEFEFTVGQNCRIMDVLSPTATLGDGADVMMNGPLGLDAES